MENRKLWLVSNDLGKPMHFAWGIVAKPSDVDLSDGRIPANGSEAQRTSWAAALTSDHEAAGWSAVSTEARRVPVMLHPPNLGDDAAASLSGRVLAANGVKLYLDDRGEEVGGGREPAEPEVEMVSDQACCDEAARRGSRFRFRERGTRKRVLVAHDGVSNEELATLGEDIVIDNTGRRRG